MERGGDLKRLFSFFVCFGSKQRVFGGKCLGLFKRRRADPLFFYSLFLSVKGEWIWESPFFYSLMIGVKRFFQTLQDKRVFPDQEDKLLLK